MSIHYLDNAASSWPKPPQVAKAMAECVVEAAANPGRGSHKMAVQASRVLFECRRNLAKLFYIPDPNSISFTMNTTMALNQAIIGFVRPGDHIICTSIEHNSVRRPLEFAKKTMGVELTYVETDQAGRLALQQLHKAVRTNTRLIVCNHGSNLLGAILPLDDIAEISHKHGIALLVDAAQTAGTMPIHAQRTGIDMLAFPGHKGLLGPQGTGGLYVNPSLDLVPLLHGGTGSQSESPEQPTVRPDRYESGTPNTPGIAGLNEGVKFILDTTVEAIQAKERALTVRLMKGLAEVEGLRLLGPSIEEPRTGIVSFVAERADSSEIAFILDQSFDIAVRAGYHCTPLAHGTAGTLDTGAVRASVGYFTTNEDVDAIIDAMREIMKHYS